MTPGRLRGGSSQRRSEQDNRREVSMEGVGVGGIKTDWLDHIKVLFEASGYIRIYNHGKYSKLSKGGSGQGSRKTKNHIRDL